MEEEEEDGGASRGGEVERLTVRERERELTDADDEGREWECETDAR